MHITITYNLISKIENVQFVFSHNKGISFDISSWPRNSFISSIACQKEIRDAQ